MRTLGIDDPRPWLSVVRVGDGYSEEFDVGVSVRQGSVFSPLLFIIVLEALSIEFRTDCPWELMYEDDLMITAVSMEELLGKVNTWKTEMDKIGLRVRRHRFWCLSLIWAC